MTRIGRISLLAAAALMVPLATTLHADPSPATTPNVVELIADPPTIELRGPQSSFSILVHGKTATGELVDLTTAAQFKSSSPGIAAVGQHGQNGNLVRGIADGQANIEIEAAGRSCTVPVMVVDSSAPRQINFERDIEPLFSRYACNTSGCHGKAGGQNGFKLSVFGFDPRADRQALVIEGRGRRVFPAEPTQSLLLRKISGELPHGGGIRIRPGTEDYQLLHDWIAAGAPVGNDDDPQVTAIELEPQQRVLEAGAGQQLRVVATTSDGRRLDVTRLARFQSNQEGLAAVDEHGLVRVSDLPGQAAIMASYLGRVDVFRVLVPQAAVAGDFPTPSETNFIDTLVHDRLHKLQIAPSRPADDAQYLRRVYWDIIGTLPTAAEARQFLADTRPDRRAHLVESLLARPEYADYWALKWADLLRVDRAALGLKGAYSYYKWIRESIAANKPLDVMTRDLLTAEGPMLEAPQTNFYKVVSRPNDMASTVAQVFLGVRLACAECHHHPYDRWSQTDFYGMQAYFQQIQRKTGTLGESLVAEGNPQLNHPRTGAPVYPHLLGTTMPEKAPEASTADRRPDLARQFTSPDNPRFARNLANRMFADFMGRGLVEPVDDVRDTNPPSNAELLDALAGHLVQNNYDAKALIRAIVASQTYGRSSEPNASNERDEQNYSRSLLRRVPAEVLLDAVCQTTGVAEKFEGVPGSPRAIDLWDSQTSHYFLKLFGRPVRVTACACERNAEPSMGQVLHLMNSPEVQRKLSHDSGRIAQLVKSIASNDQLADELYLTFYSRFPTAEERSAATAHLAGSPRGRRLAAEDLAWSLLNTLEFAFNH